MAPKKGAISKATIKKKLDAGAEGCHHRAAKALHAAHNAVLDGKDVEVLGHVLDALMALGEERGFRDASFDLFETR